MQTSHDHFYIGLQLREVLQPSKDELAFAFPSVQEKRKKVIEASRAENLNLPNASTKAGIHGQYDFENSTESYCYKSIFC